MFGIRPWRYACVPFVSILALAPAWGQSHEARSGAYTLRGSTVASTMLSPESARQHGIERSPTRGVLNVTVMQDEQTVPARIEASASNLTGRSRPIALTQTSANGYVSYTGAYDFVHGEVLDFSIRAVPQGSTQTLRLQFRDRMWGRGDLPDAQSAR